MAGYDAVFLERPTTYQALNIMMLAKDMHIKVIADFDDDVLHVPQSNPMYEVYQQCMSTTVECLVLADEIWVTTAGLKKSFNIYNRHIVVIPNAHNDYVFRVADKKQFNTVTKKALWRGGDSHEGDMYDIGTPELIIETINSNKSWEFIFYGQRFKYLEERCGDNYIAKSGASTIQFYKMIHKENPNIVFYPLKNDLFNQSKSNICWLEGSYAGAAFMGNCELNEFNMTGTMPISFLSEYVAKEGRQEVLQKANEVSWDYIQEHLLLSGVNKKREERLLAI